MQQPAGEQETTAAAAKATAMAMAMAMATGNASEGDGDGDGNGDGIGDLNGELSLESASIVCLVKPVNVLGTCHGLLFLYPLSS